VCNTSLSARLKISLDELRMQVLGAQILFGFQFQSLFQPGFDRASIPERIADAAGLTVVLASFAILLIPPAQHRLVEAGNASRRLLVLSNRCAETALATMAIALGCIAFALAAHERARHAGLIAVCTVAVASSGWFGLGLIIRRPALGRLREYEMADLHTKIDQMLTEARVILPGVQAMLGFQLIVVMSQAFDELERGYQAIHFIGLALTTLSVVLLIAPAAVHRLAFSGDDDSRFHEIGSALVTAALIPLSLAIAAESCIAAWKLSQTTWVSVGAGSTALILLLGLWYGVPMGLRFQRGT
jgi:Family of unknown function (DUF6328)